MAVTYGFYASLNKDRLYSADQFSTLFNGIINDGIFQNVGNYMTVKANDATSVNVDTGRAWFNGTWTNIDELEKVAMPDKPTVSGMSRIDSVVLKVDKNETARENSLTYVKGDESSGTPDVPKLPSEENVYYYRLANVTRKYEETTIEQSVIANCIGTSSTPFVTGVLETADITELLAQWDSEFDIWMSKTKAALDVTTTGQIITSISNQTPEYAGEVEV